MTATAKQGTFQISTGVATTQQSITGVGFKPNLVLFWYSLNTSGADAAVDGNSGIGFGAATSSSNRRATFSGWVDAAASGTDKHANSMHDDSCIVIDTLSGTPALDGLADFVSFDSGGFTLVIDDQFSAGYTIHYLALSVDVATLATITEPAATGSQEYNISSFQPELALIFSAGNGSLNVIENDGVAQGLFIGAGDGTRQIVTGCANNYSASSAQDTNYYSASQILVRQTNKSDVAQASLTTLDADGITLNWAARATTGSQYFVLMLQSTGVYVDAYVTATDTSNHAETGFGFAPTALFGAHINTVSGGDDTRSMTIGGGTGPTARSCVGAMMAGAGASVQVSYWQELDEIGAIYDSTAAVIALMDVVSLDADGWTHVMDDADAVASLGWMIAIATLPAPTVTTCTPANGPIAGGTSITDLAGTGFVNGATVTFGGTSATGVTFVSSIKLTCTTPAHTAGAVNIVVTNPDTQTGTLTNGFTYTSSGRVHVQLLY